MTTNFPIPPRVEWKGTVEEARASVTALQNLVITDRTQVCEIFNFGPGEKALPVLPRSLYEFIHAPLARAHSYDAWLVHTQGVPQDEVQTPFYSFTERTQEGRRMWVARMIKQLESTL